MSKGSKVVPIRFEDDLLWALDGVIAQVNERVKGEPYNRSTFIRKCVADEMKHLGRGRRGRRRKSTPSDNERI